MGLLLFLNEFKNFSVLISNMVNTIRYDPYKQKLFEGPY